MKISLKYAVRRLSEEMSSRDSKMETADMGNDSEIKKRQKENEKYLDAIRGSMIGGIMRVAPVGLYMNRNPKDRDEIEELDLIAAETAAITHGHELGYMPTAALAHIINRIVYSSMEPEDAVADAMRTMMKIFHGKNHLDEMISLM